MEIYDKKQRDVATGGRMQRDTPPAKVYITYDDCMTVFSEGRFRRMPICDPEVYYKLMPTERKERYKAMDLKAVGAEGQISKVVINRLHDRKLPLQLKMFSRQNPLKETRVRENDRIFTATAEYGWVELDNLRHVVDAVINYGIASQDLWPMVRSAWVLMKLYTCYSWMNYGIVEARRVKLICDHFFRVPEAARGKGARAKVFRTAKGASQGRTSGRRGLSRR